MYDRLCKVVDRQSAYKQVAQAVFSAVQPGSTQPRGDTHYLISNVDEDSMNGRGGKGSHWFAIAFSIRPRVDDGGGTAGEIELGGASGVASDMASGRHPDASEK